MRIGRATERLNRDKDDQIAEFCFLVCSVFAEIAAYREFVEQDSRKAPQIALELRSLPVAPMPGEMKISRLTLNLNSEGSFTGNNGNRFEDGHNVTFDSIRQHRP